MITHLAPTGSVLPRIRAFPPEGGLESIAANARERERMRERIKKLELSVLIVDDELPFRTALRYSLEEDYGATVADVASGNAALRADIAAYDVVLIDVKMPGMDGIRTCRKMLERRANVIMALMSTDSGHKSTAQDLEVSFYDKNHPITALEPILLSADGGGDA